MHTESGLEYLENRSLLSELKIIWAIIKKNFKIEVRYPLNFLTYTVIPLSTIVSIVHNVFDALTFGPSQGFTEYTGIVDYIAYAVISFNIWRFFLSIFQGTRQQIRREQTQGTLEVAYTTPVRRWVFTAGLCLSDFFTFLPSIFALALSSYMMGVRLNMTFPRVLMTLLIFFIGLIGNLGVELIYASTIIRYKEPGAIDMFMIHPMIYYTGAGYTVAALPLTSRIVSYLLPLTYTFDGLRWAMLGTKTLFPMHIEIALLVLVSGLFLAMGIVLVRRFERAVLLKDGFGSY